MKKRKMIALLITAVMLVGITGCSKSNNTNAEPTVTPAVTEAVGNTTENTAESSVKNETQGPEGGNTITDVPADDSKADVTDGNETSGDETPADETVSDGTSDKEISDDSALEEQDGWWLYNDGECPEILQVLTRANNCYGTWDNSLFSYVCTTSSEEISLNAEDSVRYPALAQTLLEFSANSNEAAAANLASMEQEINAQRAESDMIYLPWFDDSKAIVRRADSSAFSFLDYNSCYIGGAHGMYGVLGRNYDTAEGRELEIGEVLNAGRYEELSGYIMDKLYAYNPGELFWTTVEDIQAALEQNKINWTLDYDGVTFYWNPYEISSYASGLISIKLLFTEKPWFFTGDYVNAPSSYMVPLDDMMPYYTDLDADGKVAEGVGCYASSFDDYGDFNSVGIIVEAAAQNGDIMGFNALPAMEAVEYSDDTTYGYYHDAYYVRVGSASYIYFFLEQDSNDSALKVYTLAPTGVTAESRQLNGYSLKKTDVYYGEGDWEYDTWKVLYSPINMELYTRHDVFGTTFEYAGYAVDEEGLPLCLSSFLFMNGYQTTILKDMEFDRTDEILYETDGKVTIPAGTGMRYYRTDLNGRVDFITDDGICFAAYIDERGCINGTDILDLFDFVSMAD